MAVPNDDAIPASPADGDTFVSAAVRYGGRELTIKHVDAEDHIFKGIAASGAFYEQPMLEALGRFLSPGDLVVDAGANIGNHTLFFAGVCGCRVIAVEPHPIAYRVLRENIGVNGLDGEVTTHNVALGRETGAANFTSSTEHNLGAATLASGSGDVRIVKLDDLLAGQRPRLIKIDVEGMEYVVLEGAARTLGSSRPLVCAEAKDEAEFGAIFDYLAKFGMFVGGVYNFTPTAVFFPSRLLRLSPVLSSLSRWVGSYYVRRYVQDAKLQHRLGLLAARVEALEAAARAPGLSDPQSPSGASPE